MVHPGAFAEALQIKHAQVSQTDGIGYGRSPAFLSDDDLNVAWLDVALPHASTRRILSPGPERPGAEELTTVTWYRVPVAAHTWSPQSRYLYIPRWKMDGMITVYVNRRVVYQSDSRILWNGANTPLWIAIDKNSPAEDLSDIIVRVQHPRRSGGGISTLWVGTYEEINWRYRLRLFLQVEIPKAFSSAFLAAGLFSFFVWVRLSAEKSYLLFFAMSVGAFVRTLHYHSGITKLPIPDVWFTWLTVNSLFWLLSIIHAFLNHLHLQPIRWLDRVIYSTTVVASLVTLPIFSSWHNTYYLAPVSYITLLVIGCAASTFGLRQSIRVQSLDGILLASWSVLGMLFGIFDMLLLNNLVSIEGIYIAPLSNIGAFLILLYIIFRRYMHKHEEVIVINNSLQSRLLERENELNKSYQLLRAIELQQTLVEERQRIMQDMHDGMGSNLRTALLAVERGHLHTMDIASILKDCIDDLKLTIDSMEPMKEDLILLLATLRYRLAPRLEKAGIALHWEIEDIPNLNWLNSNVALHLLRILQEAFANIVKHAQATEIWVSAQAKDGQAWVTVRDNGIGFHDKLQHGFDGRGLENQKYRASAIGATIEWHTSEQGTRVVLALPLAREVPLNGAGRSPAE